MAKSKSSKNEQDTLIVTQQGYDDMVSELEYRKGKLREEIATEISVARDLGDISENQAYADAMERKEMNESRIDELEFLISIAQISSASESDDVVTIGHTVEVQKNGEGKRLITLVGKAETQQANPGEGKISIDSPVGKALNMARVGETVAVRLPSGEVKYKVLRIAA